MIFQLRKKCLIPLMLFMSPSMASSLTIHQVLHSVELHFPAIQSSQQDIAEAQANLLSAQGGFDPSIKSQFLLSPIGKYNNGYWNNQVNVPIAGSANQVFGGYRLGRGNFPVYDQDRWTYDIGELRAGIEVPLLRDREIDQRRGKLQQAQIAIQVSEQGLALQKISAEKDAVFSYWDWCAEGEKLRIQRDLMLLAERRQSIIEERFSQGDLPGLDISDNKRLIFQRQISVNMQQQYFQQASYLLSLFYRDNQGHPILPGISDLPQFKAPSHHVSTLSTSSVDTQIRSNPRLKQLDGQQRLSSVNLSLAKNSLLPKLDNRIYVAQDFGPGNPPLNRSSINLEVSFDLPLFRRDAKGKIMAAQRVLNKISLAKKLASDQLRVDINNAENKLQISRKVILLTEKELKLARKLEEAEGEKYTSGDSNLFQLNLREQITAETEMRLVGAIAEYYKAEASYYFALGKNQA